MPLGACQRHSNVEEAPDQFRLCVVGDQFQGTCQAHEFVRRLTAAYPIDLSCQKLVLAFARESAGHSSP